MNSDANKPTLGEWLQGLDPESRLALGAYFYFGEGAKLKRCGEGWHPANEFCANCWAKLEGS